MMMDFEVRAQEVENTIREKYLTSETWPDGCAYLLGLLDAGEVYVACRAARLWAMNHPGPWNDQALATIPAEIKRFLPYLRIKNAAMKGDKVYPHDPLDEQEQMLYDYWVREFRG